MKISMYVYHEFDYNDEIFHYLFYFFDRLLMISAYNCTYQVMVPLLSG